MLRIAKRLRILAVTAVVALSLGAFAGTAAAAPGTGLVGSCNMLLAYGVGANGGLARAFSMENVNGWDGKWVAVAASGCELEKP